MKSNLLALIAITTIALAALTGCRGGLCNACGGGNYGYAPQQPGYAPQANCGCGTPGYAAAPGVVPPRGYVQQGAYVQPGFVGQAPGVILPQQVSPMQTQPGAVFSGQ